MTARNAAGSTLILCPTELERRHLAARSLEQPGVQVELCGFGPIIAAARTAALLAERKPARVVLVGIAGTYDTATLAPGTADEFDHVRVDGVGVGEGAQFLSPAEVGFPQWQGIVPSRSEPIVDALELSSVRTSAPPRVLLTVCAASADDAHARRRRARFSNAIAEDMEGFAVAAACALANVPVRIIRGVSNVAGNRDVAKWCIAAALGAARVRLDEMIATNSGWSIS